jgi:hypothetical protein
MTEPQGHEKTGYQTVQLITYNSFQIVALCKQREKKENRALWRPKF